jgi:hypothetical protein
VGVCYARRPCEAVSSFERGEFGAVSVYRARAIGRATLKTERGLAMATSPKIRVIQGTLQRIERDMQAAQLDESSSDVGRQTRYMSLHNERAALADEALKAAAAEWQMVRKRSNEIGAQWRQAVEGEARRWSFDRLMYERARAGDALKLAAAHGKSIQDMAREFERIKVEGDDHVQRAWAESGAVDVMLSVKGKPGEGRLDFEMELSRNTELQKFAALADFGPDTYTLTATGAAAEQGPHMSKSQEYVMRYLQAHGPATIAEIMAGADTCSPAAARMAVYSLAQIGRVYRTNEGARGVEAIYDRAGVDLNPQSEE